MTEALDHVADMTRSRDRGQVDASLLTALMDLLPARRIVLWRVLGEEGGKRAWQVAGSHTRGALLPQVEQLGGEDAVEPLPYERLPLHAECFEEVALQQQPAAQGFGVLLPMASGREVEGVVELDLDAAMDAQQLRVAQAVLKIHRHFLGLLDYSERDTLTGLLNRKSFDETLLRATVVEATRIFGGSSIAPGDARRRSSARRHWLGVLDIDHFKQVNDVHGHLIGDEVLLLVARIMRGTFRFDDRLYRFGGEEFVILLTAPDDAAAGIAFERLRANLAAYPFPRVGRITGSIGYSDVRPGDTPQAAFERADRAVYHAKQHGRNQVQSQLQLVESGALDESGSVGEIELF
ncbi:MAG TPA: GGDEF domain-containing protein [Burkholderiaceae bacterium]|nr:GGDEF domain-containing protein [Burkholderiaceae bacterium]HMX11820.1 GGDEF domain-containing protein [Burkholderiaceae bacterium]HMZ01181.1 GGDEF domain-containing protein [Burkholderiaceae bacterium]HNB46056.1 GGDEF domain-containing protein [Burkholderiaceae bacterium]HNG78107.1 GGDEF domain-containing protein [Burkholderiaceae bacterium]